MQASRPGCAEKSIYWYLKQSADIAVHVIDAGQKEHKLNGESQVQ